MELNYKHFLKQYISFMILITITHAAWPTYSADNMPDTQFTCEDKILGGYYVDPEAQCQMFHICVKVPGVGIKDFRFLCPNGTAFNQDAQTCADWGDVDCDQTTLYYGSPNFDLYRVGFKEKQSTINRDDVPNHLQKPEGKDDEIFRTAETSSFVNPKNSRNYNLYLNINDLSKNTHTTSTTERNRVKNHNRRNKNQNENSQTLSLQSSYAVKPRGNVDGRGRIQQGKTTTTAIPNSYNQNFHEDDRSTQGSRTTTEVAYNYNQNVYDNSPQEFVKSKTTTVAAPNNYSQNFNDNRSSQGSRISTTSTTEIPYKYNYNFYDDRNSQLSSTTTTTTTTQTPFSSYTPNVQDERNNFQRVMKITKTTTNSENYNQNSVGSKATTEIAFNNYNHNFYDRSTQRSSTTTTTMQTPFTYNQNVHDNRNSQGSRQATTEIPYNFNNDFYDDHSPVEIIKTTSTRIPYNYDHIVRDGVSPQRFEKTTSSYEKNFQNKQNVQRSRKATTTEYPYNYSPNFHDDLNLQRSGKTTTTTLLPYTQNTRTVNVNRSEKRRQKGKNLNTIPKDKILTEIQSIAEKKVIPLGNINVQNITYDENQEKGSKINSNVLRRNYENNYKESLPTFNSQNNGNTQTSQYVPSKNLIINSNQFVNTQPPNPDLDVKLSNSLNSKRTEKDSSNQYTLSFKDHTTSPIAKKFSTLVPKDQYYPTTFRPSSYQKHIENIVKKTQSSVSPRQSTIEIDEDDGQYHPELYEKEDNIEYNKPKAVQNTRPKQDYKNNVEKQPPNENDDELFHTAHSLNIAVGRQQKLFEESKKFKTKTTQVQHLPTQRTTKTKNRKQKNEDTSYDYAYYDSFNSSPQEYDYDVISDFSKTKTQ